MFIEIHLPLTTNATALFAFKCILCCFQVFLYSCNSTELANNDFFHSIPWLPCLRFESIFFKKKAFLRKVQRITVVVVVIIIIAIESSLAILIYSNQLWPTLNQPLNCDRWQFTI